MVLKTVLTALLIFCSLPVFAGPGLDVRPEVSSSSAGESFQNLDLILMQSNDLTCEYNEDGLGRCGGGEGCGQFKDVISCLNADAAMSCEWSCQAP